MSKQGKLRDILLKEYGGFYFQNHQHDHAITHIRELIESKKKNLDGRFNWTFQYTFAKKHNQALDEILRELGE